jgi:parallel beta-helix repeat protein
MDANNTVTFQSATGDSTDVILQFSATSYSSGYTLKLNGGDYFTFKNMTIKALPGSYPGCVELGNGSEHNTFINNVIDIPVSTSSYARGFYSSNGNDDYTTIANNRIKNGYYGIYMRGSSSSNLEKGTIIKDNIIESFYYYGIYTMYQDSVEINGNHIEDGATSNYGYGIYIYYCDNETRVINNVLNLTPNYYKRALQIYYSIVS